MAAASMVLSSTVGGRCATTVTGCGGRTTEPSVTVAPLAVADIATAASIKLRELGVGCGGCIAIELMGRALRERAHELGKLRLVCPPGVSRSRHESRSVRVRRLVHVSSCPSMILNMWLSAMLVFSLNCDEM